MKKRKKILRIILIIALVCIIVFLLAPLLKKRKPEFKFASIERGNIKNTITSTGIIHPRSKIEIGTQISGTIEKIYVDFNDQVKAGQALAQIDRKILNALLDEAKAAIVNTQEQLNFSRAEYKKKKELYETSHLSEIEFLKFQSNYFIDSSNFLAATANLKKAYANIDYSTIVSPVDGMVIEKSVEVGQTVAANFNTPILFVVAEDLTKMEIHASVDESDISYIKDGQEIEFSVLAYPDSIFTGHVNQIRMHPMMIQNVVNYIVVIHVENEYGLLLPGMTATVDFIVDQKKDILKVPKTALNFVPDKKTAKNFHKKMQEKIKAMPDSFQLDMRPPQGASGNSPSEMMPKPQPQGTQGNEFNMKQPPPAPGSGRKVEMPQNAPPANDQMHSNIGQIWYIDEYGEIAMEPVQIGISDDSFVEIVRYRYLSEGMKIITGIASSVKKEKNKNLNTTQILQGQQQVGGGPPPPASGGGPR